MALTPFAPLGSLGLDTGRFYDDFFGGGGALSPFTGGGLIGAGRGLGNALRVLNTDILERDNDYELRADVPGAMRCSLHARSERALFGASHLASTLAAREHVARCCAELRQAVMREP
jgi:hypothetical protein